jgi:thiol-disulfide isomerase/thioredoxin
MDDSKILYYPVMYLDDTDFKGTTLVLPDNAQNDKPVVVMLQTSWCPHCTTAKPAFQQFADENQGKIICATIQADGEKPEEKALGNKVKEIIPGFRGFPDYCLFVKGKRVDKQIKNRSVQDLVEFSNV